ncbi:hypothetical protein FH608_011255 [Nonomuraea phyllanthi]|uniref:Uncharacterized protein n=1 Tax=Nonomuraea phyllanthi TaxID=2219224 RepID=A0A5C4WQX7_9ACTN|nr:hypothetical protein [Nonomuraea phyllanthi]KAB8196035.1 hypothetical protein FH608_011255 [Nonomuraea phyllanthi]QFY07491.1 hypothetical protein GBF35_13060 [Nonomuraea phyllanthi]
MAQAVVVSSKRFGVAILLVVAIPLVAVAMAPLVHGRNEPAAANRRFLLINALSAAHPDYLFTVDGAAPATDDAVSVLVEPRPPLPLTHGPEARRPVTLKLDEKGLPSPPELVDWRMTRALKMPDEDARRRLLPEDEALLKSEVPRRGVVALAVVWLAAPQTEESIQRFWPGGADVLFFSPRRRDRKPVSWGVSFCMDRGLPTCASDHPASPVSGFRAWVSSLTAEDQPALAASGLNLTELRGAAHSGLAYGFVASGDLDELRELAAEKSVSTLRVVDLRIPPEHDL